MRKEYIAKGFVYGKYWGGGEGAYPSITLHSKYLQPLLKRAKNNLDNLDSGMGYERVLGAILTIETIETIKRNGKEYHHSDYHDEIIGDLTEEQKNFLLKIPY